MIFSIVMDVKKMIETKDKKNTKKKRRKPMA